MIIIKNTHVQSCGFRNSLCEPVFEFIFSERFLNCYYFDDITIWRMTGRSRWWPRR